MSRFVVFGVREIPERFYRPLINPKILIYVMAQGQWRVLLANESGYSLTQGPLLWLIFIIANTKTKFLLVKQFSVSFSCFEIFSVISFTLILLLFFVSALILLLIKCKLRVRATMSVVNAHHVVVVVAAIWRLKVQFQIKRSKFHCRHFIIAYFSVRQCFRMQQTPINS